MRYRCEKCGVAQWRGYFPERPGHIRYIAFHGVSIGVFGVMARAASERFGWALESWPAGLTSVGVGLVFLFAVYSGAVALEACFVRVLACCECRSKRLRPT